MEILQLLKLYMKNWKRYELGKSLLKKLGFKHQKADNWKVLMETPSIVAWSWGCEIPIRRFWRLFDYLLGWDMVQFPWYSQNGLVWQNRKMHPTGTAFKRKKKSLYAMPETLKVLPQIHFYFVGNSSLNDMLIIMMTWMEICLKVGLFKI